MHGQHFTGLPIKFGNFQLCAVQSCSTASNCSHCPRVECCNQDPRVEFSLSLLLVFWLCNNFFIKRCKQMRYHAIREKQICNCGHFMQKNLYKMGEVIMNLIFCNSHILGWPKIWSTYLFVSFILFPKLQYLQVMLLWDIMLLLYLQLLFYCKNIIKLNSVILWGIMEMCLLHFLICIVF